MSFPKAVKKVSDSRLRTEPDYSQQEISTDTSTLNRSRYIPRVSPNLTPKGHVKKLINRPSPSPVTARSTKLIPMTERSGTPNNYRNITNGSRSPNFGRKGKNLDHSVDEKPDDWGKRFLDVTQERKYLEEQYKLMENRVKHLMDENEKIKGKIKQTRNQTQNIIKNREKIIDEEEKLKARQEAIEKEIIEKKERILKMKQQNEEKRKEKQDQVLQEKLKMVNEVKQRKARDQELKDELRREEEIKKNEKIWKIALQEKELENSKMYNRIKTRDVAKKGYESKVQTEEKRAEEVERKIKELEQLEMKLVEDLKNTHLTHLNAYAEMEKVIETRPTPRQTANNNSIFTKSTSPFRKKI